MGKFPSERRIAPRGAFKRFMRGLRARGGESPQGRIRSGNHTKHVRISVGDDVGWRNSPGDADARNGSA